MDTMHQARPEEVAAGPPGHAPTPGAPEPPVWTPTPAVGSHWRTGGPPTGQGYGGAPPGQGYGLPSGPYGGWGGPYGTPGGQAWPPKSPKKRSAIRSTT